MRGAVGNDPENPADLILRRLRHDWVYQAVKRFHARFRLATTAEFGTVHIERGKVGPSPAARILVFDLPCEPGRGGGLAWRRRAWILVVSSAQSTNSSACKGCSCQTL